MKIALLGYSGSGKTEIVSVLSGKKHESFDPFKPATTTVKISDLRLSAISNIVKPQKLTQAEITFVDIKGAPEETGFDEKIIEIASQQDHVCFVIPAFDPNRNPVSELDSLYLEMIFRDAERLKNILEKRKQEILDGKKKHSKEEDFIEKALDVIEKEKFLCFSEMDSEQKVFLNALGLITVKSFSVIVNGNIMKEQVEKRCSDYGLKFSHIDMQNITSPQLELFWNDFLKAAGLIRFYTIVGKETRAWLLPENSTVLDAASAIHTDIAKGFVRADVVGFEQFISLGSFSACREKGVLRSEARTGIVKDGDIVHIHTTR